MKNGYMFSGKHLRVFFETFKCFRGRSGGGLPVSGENKIIL